MWILAHNLLQYISNSKAEFIYIIFLFATTVEKKAYSHGISEFQIISFLFL